MGHIIHCCVTRHSCGSSQQHTRVTSPLLGVRSPGRGERGPLLGVSQGRSRVLAGCILISSPMGQEAKPRPPGCWRHWISFSPRVHGTSFVRASQGRETKFTSKMIPRGTSNTVPTCHRLEARRRSCSVTRAGDHTKAPTPGGENPGATSTSVGRSLPWCSHDSWPPPGVPRFWTVLASAPSATPHRLPRASVQRRLLGVISTSRSWDTILPTFGPGQQETVICLDRQSQSRQPGRAAERGDMEAQTESAP